MRVTEGMPYGRNVWFYNPELFQEHEEVIIFTREEFQRMYNSIQEQIDYINKVDMHLDRSEEWKLLGYWPKILERIHLIDLNMKLIFNEKPLQGYLDTYLYHITESLEEELAASGSKTLGNLQIKI